MSEVMVGVDGSPASRSALRWAAAVAEATGSPLRVVSAWAYPSGAVLAVGALDLPDAAEADAEVERRLRTVVDEVSVPPTHGLSLRALRGSPAEALLRAVDDQVRMLVVGSRGLGGFRGLLLGSVSRQLCEHAPRPVTVVRHEVDAPPTLRTILVGADGSDDAAHAMTFAGQLAVDAGAELVVVNATGWRDTQQSPEGEVIVDLDARRGWVEEWCAPLRDAGVPHRIEVVRGDPRTALFEAARAASADLVVVGSRGRGPVTELVLGSVTAALLEHCQVPVTVLPHAVAHRPVG